MRFKQFFGFLLLTLAAGYGIRKVSDSGLWAHIAGDWYSFLGFLFVALMLGAAIVRVLRS